VPTSNGMAGTPQHRQDLHVDVALEVLQPCTARGVARVAGHPMTRPLNPPGLRGDANSIRPNE